MTYELEGKLIVKDDTVQVSEKFKKREFVIEQESNNGDAVYVETIKFQSIQAKCDILDSVNIGDVVKVTFNIKGKKWEKEGKTSYFNNLDAWKIEVVGASTNDNPPEVDNSGLPF